MADGGQDGREDIKLISFPESAFPERFRDEVAAFTQAIYEQLSDDEREAIDAYDTQYQIGEYAAVLDVCNSEGVKVGQLTIRHTNLRRVARVREMLVELSAVMG